MYSCRYAVITLFHEEKVQQNSPFQFQCLWEVKGLLSIKIVENLCTGFNSSSAPPAELCFSVRVAKRSVKIPIL